MSNEPLTTEERTEMQLVATLLPSLTFDFKRFYAEPDPDKRITISRVLATIDALESELLRLAGPVCEYDKKRAVEHMRSDFDKSNYAGCVYEAVHQPAPSIQKWLSERSGGR